MAHDIVKNDEAADGYGLVHVVHGVLVAVVEITVHAKYLNFFLLVPLRHRFAEHAFHKMYILRILIVQKLVVLKAVLNVF